MILCGLFAAVISILSQILVFLPFTPVPINLALVGVFTAGALLGAKYAALSVVIYILLGAAGLPVFAGFSGGAGHLFSPTGGFIAGYVPTAAVVGIICQKHPKQYAAYVLSMVLGLLVCYVLGAVWFVFVTKTTLFAALTSCVFPFLIGDALKILAASFFKHRLGRFTKN